MAAFAEDAVAAFPGVFGVLLFGEGFGDMAGFGAEVGGFAGAVLAGDAPWWGGGG